MKFLSKIKNYLLNLNRLDRITLLTLIFFNVILLVPNNEFKILYKFSPLLKANTKSVEIVDIKDKELSFWEGLILIFDTIAAEY